MAGGCLMRIMVQVTGPDAELSMEELWAALTGMEKDEMAHQREPARVAGITLGSENHALAVTVIYVDDR